MGIGWIIHYSVGDSLAKVQPGFFVIRKRETANQLGQFAQGMNLRPLIFLRDPRAIVDPWKKIFECFVSDEFVQVMVRAATSPFVL